VLTAKIAEQGELPQLYVVLGIVYRESGRPEKALDAFAKAVELDGEDAQAQFYLATQLSEAHRRDEARKVLRKVLTIDPNHADALNYLGYLDAEDGVNLEQAKANIERALAQDPHSGAYLDSLGWVNYKLGDLHRAVKLLEQAVEAAGNDPVVLEHLADTYFRLGERELARKTYQRAIENGADEIKMAEKLEQIKRQEVTIGEPAEIIR